MMHTSDWRMVLMLVSVSTGLFLWRFAEPRIRPRLEAYQMGEMALKIWDNWGQEAMVAVVADTRNLTTTRIPVKGVMTVTSGKTRRWVPALTEGK